MATGTVIYFHEARGFGFIKPDSGGFDVFLHISALESAGRSSVKTGTKVDYDIVIESGRERAVNLSHFIDPPPADDGIYADHIIGNTGANGLIGNSGNDRIDGGGGDLLTGSAGDDTFVFNAEFEHNTVSDFQGGDLIEFNYDVFADPQAVLDHTSQVGSDVVITADADNSIILESVTLSDLHTNDFYFVA